MENASPPLLQRIWRTARPWIVTIAVVLILRYTGLLAGISQATGTLLLKTGIVNASTGAPAVIRDFNYDFELQDLEGNRKRVSQLRNKVLFVNMWATWCGPCRVEMPSIQALYNDVDTSRVAFLMISVDDEEDQHKVRRFVTDKGYTFPVYTLAGSLPELLEVRSIPATFVVAKNGKVVMKESGVANYNTKKVKKFLRDLSDE